MHQSNNLWRSRGLRWGMAVATLLGSSLLAMFGLMYWRSSILLFKTLDRSVVEQLDLLSARPPDMLPFMITSRMNRKTAVLTEAGLFGPDGVPIVGDITAMPRRMVLDGKVHAVTGPDNPAAHWHAAARKLADGRILVVARGVDEILEVRRDLVRGAVVGIIPAILLSLGGGALVGVASERRLRSINAVTDRIIAGDLSERLPARAGGDELDRLCIVVNRMLDRLDQGVEALKGVGENIAHDLRTPLTSVRARLEKAVEQADSDTPLGRSIERSIQGVDQALSIVTALLRIAEIQHIRRKSAFTTFDLAEIVRETADSYQPVAEEKRIELTCAAAGETIISGDRQLMIEALVNVVDNAVKFTPPGGRVGVLVGGTDQPIVTISDTGPGIDPGARSAVFQRFYRTEASRTTEGSGLGLSLVAAVMRLHGFSVRLSDGAPGCKVELLCWDIDLTSVPF